MAELIVKVACHVTRQLADATAFIYSASIFLLCDYKFVIHILLYTELYWNMVNLRLVIVRKWMNRSNDTEIFFEFKNNHRQKLCFDDEFYCDEDLFVIKTQYVDTYIFIFHIRFLWLTLNNHSVNYKNKLNPKHYKTIF